MNKIIILLMIILTGIACSNQNKNTIPAENESFDSFLNDSLENKALSEYFTEKKSGGLIKVQPKVTLSENGTGFYVYFTKNKNEIKDLKLFIQFEDRDIYQFSVKGQKYTYKSNFSKGSGKNKINWYDYKMSAIDIGLLYALIKSESARIIFSDGTSVLVSDEDRESIRRTLAYFEELGGRYPPYIQ